MKRKEAFFVSWTHWSKRARGHLLQKKEKRISAVKGRKSLGEIKSTNPKNYCSCCTGRTVWFSVRKSAEQHKIRGRIAQKLRAAAQKSRSLTAWFSRRILTALPYCSVQHTQNWDWDFGHIFRGKSEALNAVCTGHSVRNAELSGHSFRGAESTIFPGIICLK